MLAVTSRPPFESWILRPALLARPPSAAIPFRLLGPGMVRITSAVHCWPLPRRSLKMVLPRGLAPRASAFAGRRAELLHFRSIEKRAPCRCRPGARLAHPPTSSIPFLLLGGLESVTAEASLKTGRGALAAWRPELNTAVLAVTPMTPMKVVAASGIAPDSPRLQRGANLSQLHSQWSLRAVSRRGLSVIGRLLCF